MPFNSKDNILQQDIAKVSFDLQKFPEIKNKNFFITGASGLLGSLVVKALLHLNSRDEYNISVYALVRSIEKAEAVFGELLENERLIVIVGDIQDIPQIDGEIDYIIHGASVTSSTSFVKQPVETIATAINGTFNVLELAKMKQVSSMVYLSSLEVYGTLNSDVPITEECGGYIDSLSVRSSYSESKRMAENLCSAFCAEYKVPVKIARLTQTFGAGVSYDDNRVFAQFARSVIEKKNIVLHTEGTTVRNYCYTSDAVRALFYILLKGESGKAFNVANMETSISISDMAKLAASLGSNTEIVFDLNNNINHGYNPVMKICLDTSNLNKLGWSAEVGLLKMYQNLMTSMKTKKGYFTEMIEIMEGT
ncbi:NAD-dependent epimerase/dehydratase family protein [Paenibacillus camerounensis]|uniref:NAD-dependent epimerase/dehydratase family protein n=1 Tax=Paenibacillus camerounensis TaxID=1243663 RepID=UPI0005A9E982|nr:NAD-dependent epimerase/dehydratase family protein [Paenibacillus camerounensis]